MDRDKDVTVLTKGKLLREDRTWFEYNSKLKGCHHTSRLIASNQIIGCENAEDKTYKTWLIILNKENHTFLRPSLDPD